MTPDANDRRTLLLHALKAVEDLKARVRASEEGAIEPLAIVGAACRFPGDANSLDEYWELLEQGHDAVREIPAARWGTAQLPVGAAAWRAGLVNGLDLFDPRFFGISAREATTLDPQQRMVLEVAWQALEGGGQNTAKLAESQTGVFIGITGRDYGQIVRDAGSDLLDVYTATGNANNAAAGRLSYFLGLQGPSISVDTACSSSLVAVHLACQSLRSGESRMAIAGGVNALLTADPFVCFSNWGMMAPDGRCKAFDAHADGFVRAEGCGMVVLKRLRDAVADGDHILALIRGSAVNQDGRSSGLTVPNGPAQEAVIRQALANGGVKPEEIDYVEAHGTGTSLGDPIEAHALAAVLGAGRSVERPLVVGSVKTNLGHLESASGVAGLIKVVLSLQHEHIPRHLHFQQMNPQIDWKGMAVEIPVEGRAWPKGEKVRRAGVSSFGFSGTNAHVIVEEAPAHAPRVEGWERPEHILALSARSEKALGEVAEAYRRHLRETPAAVADVCYTANAGRVHFAERLVVSGATAEELMRQLESGGRRARVAARTGVKAAWLFTGQGSQYPGMGRELYATQPVFRATMDRCAELLRNQLTEPLLEVLYGGRGELLDETGYTQPALFALEYALAQMWRSWGLEPSVVLGHSVGEYVAACVAGIYGLEEGLNLIALRGRLMQGLPRGGAMAAVSAPEVLVRKILARVSGVSVAAVNGPSSVVISGHETAVGEVERELGEAGIATQRLVVSHAFHSELMEQVAEEFGRQAAAVPMKAPRVTLISSVTGQALGREEAGSAEYWREQVREAVRFQAAMEELDRRRYAVYMELGPAPVMSGMGQNCVGTEEVYWAPSLRKGRSEWQQILDSLGGLYLRGAEIDWAGFDAGYPRRRVPQPTYPFERQRYWIDASSAAATRRVENPRSSGAHPLLGIRTEIAAAPDMLVWETDVSTETHPYLADHCIQGRAVFPAAAYMEIGFAVAREEFGGGATFVDRVEFRVPLFVSTRPIRLQISLSKRGTSEGEFRVFSRQAAKAEWTLHAVGFAGVTAAAPENAPLPSGTRSGEAQLAAEEFYQRFSLMGNNWGPAFQGVQRAWIGNSESWTEIDIPDSVAGELASYLFHPAVSDACGHGLAAITDLAASARSGRGAFVGEQVGRATVYAPPQPKMIAHARIRDCEDRNLLIGDVTVFGEDGSVLTDLTGARLRYIDESQQSPEPSHVMEWFHRVVWQPAEIRPSAAPPPGNWLLVSDDLEFRSALASEIAISGHSTVISDVQHLLSASENATGVIFGRAASVSDAAGLHQGCDELVELVRAIRNRRSCKLWIVTRRAQRVDIGGAGMVPWQAPFWGIGRTLAIEHPEIWGGLVDLDPANLPADSARALWKHLSNFDGEDQVAFRDGRRFAARLERASVKAHDAVRLSAETSYLITGGLGGLGLAVAGWLVERGARNLILMSRTPLPAEEEPGSDRITHSQRPILDAIRTMQASGVKIESAAVDVGDENAVRAFWQDRLKSGGPPIRGIVHAAGVLEHQLLVQTSTADLQRLFQAKVLGAWNLHLLAAAEPLDFFVLFSSASSILSSPRLGGYAAANAFLDGLAEYRRSLDLPACAVNWGMWRDAGMATRLERQAVDSLAQRGMGSISTAEGLIALEAALLSSFASVAVLPVDWRKWAKLYPESAASPLLVGMQAGLAPARESVIELPVATRDDRISLLRRLLSSIAGFPEDQIDLSVPITEYGLDSLMSLDFKNRLNRQLGLSIPMVRFLEGPSIGELADEIAPLLRHPASVALPSVGEQARYPLSPEQRALWFLQTFAPASAAYNVALSALAKPALNREAFESALRWVVERHAALRTVTALKDGVPVQIILRDFVPRVEEIDARGWCQETLRAAVIQHHRQPFRLDEVLFRAALFRSETSDVLLLTLHHLIFDGWSAFLVFEDLRKAYQARINGQGLSIVPPAAEYQDYVLWRETLLASPEMEQSWEYWSSALGGELPVLRFLRGRPRPPVPSGGAGSAKIIVEATIGEGLREVARENKTTLFTVLLAAYQILLYEASGQSEIIVGSPVSGRNLPQWMEVVGNFVNMVALRGRVSPESTFSDLVSQIRGTVLGALEHQAFPFSLVVDRLRIPRSASHSPVFQAMFNLQLWQKANELTGLFIEEPGAQGTPFGDTHLHAFVIPQQEGQYDITLELFEAEGRLTGNLKFNADILTEDTGVAMARRFVAILTRLAAEPGARLNGLAAVIGERDEIVI